MASEKEVLELGVDLKKGLADMVKWQKAILNHMQKVGGAVDKVSKATKKASEESVEGHDAVEKGLSALTKAYKQEGAEIAKYDAILSAHEKRASKASDDELVNLKEQIAATKKLRGAKIAALKGKEKKQGIAAATEMFGKKSREELKESVKTSVNNIFGKDLKQSVENSAKTLVKSLKMTAGATAVGGSRLRGFGAGLAERGAAKGGGSGAAMQAGGAALKGIGGLMAKMGPLIQSMSSIAPMLGVVSSSIMGIVKLFLDLDSKAKEFNKDILASASTSEFLSDAGGNADAAFVKMETTLKGVRDAAFEVSNIDWGISADTHKAILNTLNQEGVSLKSIGQQGGKSAEEIQGFVSELSHVSVAYSRAFGIPLQEINQLQSEMVQEMGIGLAQTGQAFEQVNRSAAEAGVGANKFFGMIKGVSQDLSLWNNRMADAANLLGKLMKNMSPRTAQSFFQTLQKGFKGVGRTELLKTTLLAGVKDTGKIMKQQLEANIRGLAASVGNTLGMDESGIDNLAKSLKENGRAALTPLVDRLPDEMKGEINEALTKMELQQSRMKKGAYGLGEALADSNPVAAAEIKVRQMMSLSGEKDLTKAAGSMAPGAMADNMGVGVEEYNQLATMQKTMEDQRNILKDKLMDPDVQKKLAKAGIKGTTKGIEDASWAQVMDTLPESQQDLLKGVTEQEKLARSQAKAQTSFYDQFSVLVDFLMNKLYNVFLGISDMLASVADFLHIGGDSRVKAKLRNNAEKGSELNKVLQSDDTGAAFVNSAVMKQMNATLVKLPQALAERARLKEEALSSEDPSVYVSKLEALDKEIASMQAAKAILDKGLSGRGRTDAKDVGNIGETRRNELFQRLSLEKQAKLFTELEKAQGGPSAPVQAVPSSGSSSRVVTTTGANIGAPTAPTIASPASVAGGAAKAAEENLSLTKDQLQTLHSVDNQLDKIKMDTGFLSGPYSRAMETSVLGAMRTALFEYYMYKDLDQQSVVDAMQGRGLNAAGFSQRMGAGAQFGSLGQSTLEDLGAASPNATGGLVTGVNGGLAMVTAAAGEGLASVGAGERIVPAGGSAGGNAVFNINVQGVGGRDLERIIRAKVIDGVHEYKRKERFH